MPFQRVFFCTRRRERRGLDSRERAKTRWDKGGNWTPPPYLDRKRRGRDRWGRSGKCTGRARDPPPFCRPQGYGAELQGCKVGLLPFSLKGRPLWKAPFCLGQFSPLNFQQRKPAAEPQKQAEKIKVCSKVCSEQKRKAHKPHGCGLFCGAGDGNRTHNLSLGS